MDVTFIMVAKFTLVLVIQALKIIIETIAVEELEISNRSLLLCLSTLFFNYLQYFTLPLHATQHLMQILLTKFLFMCFYE